MIEWMILPFKRYAQFTGRSRRMEYWSFVLLNVVVIGVLFLLLFGTGAGFGFFNSVENDPADAIGAMFFGGFGIVILLYWFAVLVPWIAVTVRRLHDRDMSGWWYLGFIVASMIPFVGWIASIALLVILVLPGTPGSNRFGPDPKDPAGVEVFS